MSLFSRILRITEKDFRILRAEIRHDLLEALKIIKRLALIFGFILAPWIPAYVVQKTIVDQHQAELDQYLNRAMGGIGGYTDTLFTLNRLCVEYKRTSEEERVRSRFYQRFDHYMEQSIKWRARLSENVATIKNYLGPKADELSSDFMFITAYWGFTPQEYCSHPPLKVDFLICKEREIRKAAIDYRPSLKQEIPLDRGGNPTYQIESRDRGIHCPPY